MSKPQSRRKPPSNSFACSISESLEQLAEASQRLADLAAKAIGLEDPVTAAENAVNAPDVEVARETLAQIFAPESIEGYDGSESMEKARVAHLDAALEMYIVMAEDPDAEADLAKRIGQALLKELTDYYHAVQNGNERVTFTTEQRTALESAFLLKPKLNTAEKRALAKTCNLNPRQVEVWVRARHFVYAVCLLIS